MVSWSWFKTNSKVYLICKWPVSSLIDSQMPVLPLFDSNIAFHTTFDDKKNSKYNTSSSFNSKIQGLWEHNLERFQKFLFFFMDEIPEVSCHHGKFKLAR